MPSSARNSNESSGVHAAVLWAVMVSLPTALFPYTTLFRSDANNNAPPDVTNEVFSVGKASPTLATTILQPSGPVTAGNVTVQDRATIGGGFSPKIGRAHV